MKAEKVSRDIKAVLVECEINRITRKNSFPGGSVVKNLPAVPETWVQSLGQEDPLEKEMANCLRTLTSI